MPNMRSLGLKTEKNVPKYALQKIHNKYSQLNFLTEIHKSYQLVYHHELNEIVLWQLEVSCLRKCKMYG